MLTFDTFYAAVSFVALVALVIHRVRGGLVEPLVGHIGLFVTTAAFTFTGMLHLIEAVAAASQPAGFLRLVSTGSMSAMTVLLGAMLVQRLRNRGAEQPAQ